MEREMWEIYIFSYFFCQKKMRRWEKNQKRKKLFETLKTKKKA